MTILFLRSVVFVKPISALDTGSTMMSSLGGKSEYRPSLPSLWESVLSFEPRRVGPGDAIHGNTEEKIPELLSPLPFSLCFYGVVGWEGKLLPWLQPTWKQKRWL